MAAPIKHGGKKQGQSVRNEAGVVGLKRTREHTNIFGEVYETNKAAKKRIYAAIKDFYKK